MEESRTKNSIRNVKAGAIVQIINKLMAFVVQTVFIKMLNTEYLGINGLFTNILTILSFAELGIGTAIIYNMYKPVSNNNVEKIKSLMYLYKESYNAIGVIVFIIGLGVIPFMRFFIGDVPNIKENLIFIYLLFLFNTSVSYFFTYKKSIIYAHQKQSIIDNIDSVFYIIKSLVLIFFLVVTRNFIVYLCIQIISTMIENVIVSQKANKMYPYLKDKNVKKLIKGERNGIFKNVKSLIVYKFGSVIMYGTDNILISALLDVSTVGLCSNYNMIINAIKTIISSALNGLNASIGNLNAVGESEKKEKVFYQITFIHYIVYSFCSIALLTLMNPFIKIWLGSNYLLENNVSIALAINCFIEGLRMPGYTFRTTLGLFQKGKITPYIGAITNIVLSVVLCKKFGLSGIFIATSIAQLVSYSWIDPYLIHKYEFKTPVKKYFKKYIGYSLAFLLNIITVLYLSTFNHMDGIMGFVIEIMLVCLVPNIINLIIFHRADEFKSLKDKFIQPILKKIKNSI